MKKLILCLLIISNIHAVEVDWPKNNAVAYIAKKTMFLVSDKTVVGINSNIAFSKATLNKGVILTVSIPIADFKTDDADRDEDVQKILKVDQRKFLIFRSEKMNKESYKSMLDGQSVIIEGLLAVGKKNYPVKFRGLRDGQYILFDFESTFRHFEIEPPKVAFGLVAKAKDYLVLKARINLNDF